MSPYSTAPLQKRILKGTKNWRTTQVEYDLSLVAKEGFLSAKIRTETFGEPAEPEVAQRLQNPLIKEYASNYNGNPSKI